MAPPLRCSGDMYGSVPMMAAVSVSRVTSVPASDSASKRAMPKSARRAPSSASSTFAGFEIAVDHAARVRVVQRREQASEHGGGLGGRQRAGGDARAQVAAFDQRHREPRDAVLDAVAQHADDRRVRQARERLDLAREPRHDVRAAGQRRRQELQRHLAPVGGDAAVDGPHAAAAQARLDASAAYFAAGAIDLGHEARAAGLRAGARDVDFGGAGGTRDDAVGRAGQGRVTGGAEQIQELHVILALQGSSLFTVCSGIGGRGGGGAWR